MKEEDQMGDVEKYILMRFAQLEEQNAALTTLYVASQSLHNSLKRSDVLLSVREIVANLIGCEEYALFSLNGSGALLLVDSFGIDSTDFEQLGPAMKHIETVHQTGESFWSNGDEVTACVPLRLNGSVTGVLTLFRLLPQKFELHESDRDLLRLLELQLANALYCAELHEKQIGSNEVVS